MANVGIFGGDIERPVQRSDSAVRYARAYRSAGRRATAGLVAGFAFLALGAARCSDGIFLADCPRGADALMLSALVIGPVYSGFERRRARRALSRAVGWYNRSLR